MKHGSAVLYNIAFSRLRIRKIIYQNLSGRHVSIKELRQMIRFPLREKPYSLGQFLLQ
jgi:hypothetical protein